MKSEISKTNIVIPSLDLSKAHEDKITIGKGNIFQPGVLIETQGGEVVIGDNNIFEEKTKIYNMSVKIDGKLSNQKMVIGNGNIFKVQSKVFTSNIGNYNIFGEKSSIDLACNIKDGCEIAPGSTLPRFSKISHKLYND